MWFTKKQTKPFEVEGKIKSKISEIKEYLRPCQDRQFTNEFINHDKLKTRPVPYVKQLKVLIAELEELFIEDVQVNYEARKQILGAIRAATVSLKKAY